MNPDYHYSLELIKDDSIFPPFGAVYAIGNCVPKDCRSDSIKAINSVVYTPCLLNITKNKNN